MALAGRSRAAGGAAVRPGILVLAASGWRGQALPGREPGLTAPGLERLAAEGLVCTRAYTPNPEGSPGAAAILTGRFPHACGVKAEGERVPRSEPVLATALLEAGYVTGRAGPWPIEDAPEPEAPASRVSEPDLPVDLASGFIRRYGRLPFFLAVSWSAPSPLRGALRARIPPDEGVRLDLRPNVPAEMAGEGRRLRAAYQAACSAVGTGVERLLSLLDEAGLAAGTIVVFTSTHGEMLLSHGLEGAGVPYEEAVRVPLIIRFPGRLAAGARFEAPVSTTDLAPTLLSLAGVAPLENAQGRDLAAALASRPAGRPESVYCQGRLGTSQEWRMVVRGLDKIVVDRELEVTHLHNLGQDPYEMENLAAGPEHRRKRDEMSAILRDWMQRTGDRILPSGLKLRD